MTDEIGPALTPSQWDHRAATQDRSTGSVAVRLNDGGALRVHEWLGEHRGDELHTFDDVDIVIPEALRHPLAAFALHGQAFGFTARHVAALEYQTFGTRRHDLLAGMSMTDIASVAHEAIARLAALLPPSD